MISLQPSHRQVAKVTSEGRMPLLPSGSQGSSSLTGPMSGL
jgi:hypothetical protein